MARSRKPPKLRRPASPRRTRHALKGDSSIRDIMRIEVHHLDNTAQQLFSVVLEWLKAQGMALPRAHRAFRQALRQLQRSPYRLKDASNFQIMLQIADLLASWHRDPGYLSEEGKPRPLALIGARSFETLAKRYLPQFEPRELADILVREKMLDRRRDNRLLPNDRAAVFAKPNPMTFDRMPVLIRGLLSTATHNETPATRKKGTRPERGTNIARLPLKVVPAFNEQVKRLGRTLLDSIDAWAERYELPADQPNATRTARVGVEVFGFVEENLPTRVARNRRTKR